MYLKSTAEICSSDTSYTLAVTDHWLFILCCCTQQQTHTNSHVDDAAAACTVHNRHAENAHKHTHTQSFLHANTHAHAAANKVQQQQAHTHTLKLFAKSPRQNTTSSSSCWCSSKLRFLITYRRVRTWVEWLNSVMRQKHVCIRQRRISTSHCTSQTIITTRGSVVNVRRHTTKLDTLTSGGFWATRGSKLT